ncbi:MAG: hypothetical protein OEZ39_02965 [Gammaproteobacteria bacterium]|nr:hypothetical protein [Gammaproteobacteria bacterium]MDH5650817.1 hypothetical protein [Gammaproteobacteria bacterium]
MAVKVEKAEYQDVRDEMRPGDVIAFSGKGNFSDLIRFATASTVSHVGVILHTKIPTDTHERYFNQIIESATIRNYAGVHISRMSDRLKEYDGEIWWLPLSDEVRNSRFNAVKFYEFLFQAEGKKYDTLQALKAGTDWFDSWKIFGKGGPGYNEEDFGKFFCSELVAGGLEAAGSVGNINASEVTPIDLCRWNIYSGKYYQLKGDVTNITRYNTADPNNWGFI